jgi:transposase
MPVGYSVDLRWRAVWLHLICGKSRCEIADLLFMSKRSVDRYIALYQSTGTVEPSKQRHGPPCVLSEFEQISLLQSLVNKPTMYLEELQSELYELTGTWVHVSTICRTVQHLRLTRKKVQRIALQCSEELQLQFMAEISMFDPEMIIWVDETGSARRNSVRSYGYSLKGMRAVSHELRVSGQRINAIGAMSTEGMEDVYIVEGNVTGEVFVKFVRNCLLPILQPFNGTNSHSVVVMDNASVHHYEEVADIITGVGSIVRFLPPYSPELNPIENAFSKVKAFLRANDSVYLSTHSPCTVVLMAFCTITKDDCINYVRHSGYMH